MDSRDSHAVLISAAPRSLALCVRWAGAARVAMVHPLRSTCGGRCQGRTRRIPAWRSTSAGRWSNDLDLNGRWGEGSDFLLHPVSNTGVHGGTTRENSVGVEVLSDVNVALHDGVVDGLMDAAGFHTQEGRLEEGLRAAETLVANGDDLSIRQFIGLLEGSGSGGGGHFLLEVQSHIAQLLLDVTHDFSLSCR
ncbi:hypothetical protein J437_LFUL015608 [Ladona fulva]|uniref:Uncharacterized protein n=1 Tax=Ladona fulva TaxID=123851 RepID=A0A8K0KK46_LADFU|nr:hypothetical protein J437_LFUL015608 [Ladona fulva]